MKQPCDYCDQAAIVTLRKKRGRRIVRLCARHVSPTAALTPRQRALVGSQRNRREVSS